MTTSICEEDQHMTNIRKSIVAAFLGLAVAGVLGMGATELYASVASDSGETCPSVCPLDETAAASCPVDKAASCPTSAAGA